METMHNQELHNMCSAPTIFRIFKLRRIRWARHVVTMGTNRNACRVLVGKARRKENTTKTYV
jgi:hypothetical protein